MFLELCRKVWLYNIFTTYKNDFILGVSNKHNVTDFTGFLYYNICPKLQIHDLVIHERISGVAWSRFETTKKANELLVYIEKMNLEEQSKSNKA